MASNEFEPEEIDRLVKELATPRRAPAPEVASRAGADAPAPPADSSPLTPGRRYTTARLVMPAARTERRERFAFASGVVSAIRLPALPRFALPALTGLMDSSTLPARLFVALGVLLGAAMPYWPYAHAWSWGLLMYFAAVMLVMVTGIWGAKLTWDARLPAAHTVAVGTVVWGLGLLASEAVPRIVSA